MLKLGALIVFTLLVATEALDDANAPFLPDEFNATNFTLSDAKRLLRQQCRKAGVDNAAVYAQLEAAAVQLKHCANTIANLTVVLQEIEQARPRGQLDLVFQKYCERRPHAEQCLRDFNAQLLPCLTPVEQAQNALMLGVLTSLLGFICLKNGDQIALFIAEEGPECLEANRQNIANCMNASFAAYMPSQSSESAAVSKLPELVMGPKQCIDLYDFEECVLGYLEQCNEITPSNIIESLFKYVKNETKCQPEIDKVFEERRSEQQNDGGKLMVAFNTFIVVLICAILVD